jgi:hypothetical protein
MIEMFSEDASMPGRAVTAYVSWEDIASALGLDEQWEFLSPDNVPYWVRKAAFVEAEQYVSPNTSGDRRIELETKIIDSIVSHWTPASIIPKNVNFEKLFSHINRWSNRDPANRELFGKAPTPGCGIQWISDDGGLQLTVYPPFEIPYVESYYKLYRYLPELNMDELSGFEIMETCYFVEEALGSSIGVDLSNWDNLRLRLFDLIEA